MPRGGATSLTPVYAGLQADLDAFLRAFLRLESCRFVDYKKLFNHIGMIKLFNGRSNSAEIIEFNEHLLVYCQQYIHEYHSVSVKRTLEERLFGLYSMYTFFFLQQINHVVKIKMDVYSLQSFNALAKLVCEEEILDAMLCCQKLKEHKAIRAVAFSSAYDPTSFKRYRTEANLNGLPLVANVHNPLGTLKDMLKSPLFLKLGVAHEEYTKLKMNSEIDFGACFGNPLQAATDALRRTGWEADLLITNPIIPKEPKKQQLSRSSIKDRAYTTKVKHAKHRMPDAYQSTESFDYKTEELECEEVGITLKTKLPFKKINVKKPKEFDMKDEEPEDDKFKDKNLKMLKELHSDQTTKSSRKRGRPRKDSNQINVRLNCNESKLAKKARKSDEPVPVKASGRRTNNSVASELFSLENPPAVDRNIKKEELDEIGIEQEIKKDIGCKKIKKEVSVEFGCPVAEEKLITRVKMEIHNDATNINFPTNWSSSSTPLLKSNIKSSTGTTKSVSFQERNGELVVMVRDITPLPVSTVEEKPKSSKNEEKMRTSDVFDEPEKPKDDQELTFMEEISCEIFTPLPDGEQEEGLIDSDFDFSGDDTDTESNIS